jgi:hypothetical protein
MIQYSRATIPAELFSKAVVESIFLVDNIELSFPQKSGSVFDGTKSKLISIRDNVLTSLPDSLSFDKTIGLERLYVSLPFSSLDSGSFKSLDSLKTL